MCVRKYYNMVTMHLLFLFEYIFQECSEAHLVNLSGAFLENHWFRLLVRYECMTKCREPVALLTHWFPLHVHHYERIKLNIKFILFALFDIFPQLLQLLSCLYSLQQLLCANSLFQDLQHCSIDSIAPVSVISYASSATSS